MTIDPFAPLITTDIDAHIELAGAVKGLIGDLGKAAAVLCTVLGSGQRLLLCGNGGSAADAQHLAAELTGRFLKDRDPLPAIALHTNTSALTAIGNDYGYGQIFAREVRAQGRAGDALIALSTSGNSENVLQAASAAKELAITTIALTGRSGGRLADMADIALRVPSDSTPRTQEMHILIGHILCGLVEAKVC